jgi:hypothetical protein
MSAYPITEKILKMLVDAEMEKHGTGLKDDYRYRIEQTLEIIRNYVDRPQDEQDALMAFSALMLLPTTANELFFKNNIAELNALHPMFKGLTGTHPDLQAEEDSRQVSLALSTAKTMQQRRYIQFVLDEYSRELGKKSFRRFDPLDEKIEGLQNKYAEAVAVFQKNLDFFSAPVVSKTQSRLAKKFIDEMTEARDALRALTAAIHPPKKGGPGGPRL